MRFYSHFNLSMDRSPGFGSTAYDSSALFRLALASAPYLHKYLTLPHTVTRRSVLQKVRGRTLIVLPPLVNTGFQVLFHSPPGVLFTFPSRYYTLSVTKSCLALEGGPPCFPQGFTCPVVLWILTMQCSVRLPDCHRLRSSFPTVFSSTLLQLCKSTTPKNRSSSVWAVPRSLAAT